MPQSQGAMMLDLDFHPAGRHFLQIPGPSPVPDRILRAMSLPTIDHRGPEFGALGRKVLADVRKVFKTRQPVVIYPASGTGAWEAALVNTLSPGDRVLMVETGHFATLWQKMATRLGLATEVLVAPGSDALLPEAPHWRQGVQADLIEARLRRDGEKNIKAVCVVHNETSTGVALRHRRGAARDRRRRPPGPAAGRLDLRPRLRRPAPRRVGHRRHDRRLAEGPDAAARHRLQRDLAARARGGEDGDAAARVLGLGRDRRHERRRLLAVDAEHQPALRPQRVARHAARRGPRQRVRAPPALGRRRARRRQRVGPADPVRRSGVLLAGADRRDDAGRRRCRRGAPPDPRALRPLARHRPRQGQGPHVPDRPPRRQQRPDAARRAGRLRDGPEAGGVRLGAARGPRAGHLAQRAYRRRPFDRHSKLDQAAALGAPRLFAHEWPNAPVRIVVGFRPAAAPMRWRASSPPS